jgi:astacin
MMIYSLRKISSITLLSLLIFVSGCYEAVITQWDKGEIPYFLSGYFSQSEVDVIQKAMKRWESACGVKFYEVDPSSAAYEIIRTKNSNDWSSTIGENNVQCYMYFGEGSDQYGHCLHELGHCLGLLHEQQRPDRDQYVTIIWDNIWPEYRDNFRIENNPLLKEGNYPYDYESIMHYGSTAFSFNGYPTIIPQNSSAVIGQRSDVTNIDIEKVRSIYGPPQ